MGRDWAYCHRFVQRVLAPSERPRVYAILGRPPPLPAVTIGEKQPDTMPKIPKRLGKAAEFMAGRFAAKEAAIKAHRHLRLTFHDIIITTRSELERADAKSLRPILPGNKSPVDEAEIQAEDKTAAAATASAGPSPDDMFPAREEGGFGSEPPVAIVLENRQTGRYQEARISISHDGEYCTAICMAHLLEPPSMRPRLGFVQGPLRP